MVRPKCTKKIDFCPKYREFKPKGCVASAKSLELLPEEAEALNLKDLQDFEQVQAAKKMGISQSTFQRILKSARKKVAKGILEGGIIKLKDK